MGEKYLQSKSGSLEDLATKIASKQSEVKVEQKVKLETPKTYLGLKENSVTAVAARVVSESLIKEEKFKADYTIEKRAPRHISDEEDEVESYGSITVSAKDAGEAKKKIEDEIDKRIDKMKKNPNLKGYSFEGYIDGSVQKISESLDPVNKDAVKKDFKNRNDKDIDNDGDVDSTDKYLHTRRQAISKAVKSETHTFTAQPINQKQKDTKGEKEVINPLKQKIKENISKLMGEGRMKDIATDKSELERLRTRLSQLQDKKAADTGDTTKIEKDILQTQRSIKDVQLKLKDVPKEVKNEAVDEPYAVGMAQAKKLTGDKPPLEKSTITKAHDIAKAIMKKEQDVSKAAVDKFHTKLDKLVHKSFGHSSDEKKVKTEKKTYSNLKAEVENGKKTMTGQKPATIDTEPRTQHI